LSLRGFEVKNDTPLVRVIRSEPQAAVRMRNIAFERPFAAHRIAGWRFDENHLRTEVGQK
jgi:hypothetical protein